MPEIPAFFMEAMQAMPENIAEGSTIRWGSKFPFFMVLNSVFDLKIMVMEQGKIREIWPIEKLVFLYLSRCCCNDSGIGFPSYATIADRCGISRRAAIYAVDILRATGLTLRPWPIDLKRHLKDLQLFKILVIIS
jgi:hypothetical protein